MRRKQRKNQYAIRRSRGEIVKDVLNFLALAGTVYVAASSPYFVSRMVKQLRKQKKYQKYQEKRLNDTFSRFSREGLLKVEERNNQIYISLTDRGKQKAGWLQIDDLRINRAKQWDNKWRLVIFDIAQLKRTHREAFRGKLKQLGFHPLQKSIWILPFECLKEIQILRKFFGLDEKEMRLVLATNIGSDKSLRKLFKV